MTTRRSASPLGAGLRSLIVPGWGQLTVRQRGLGWFLIIGTAIVLALAGWLVHRLGAVEVMARLTDPEVLLGMIALNLVVGAGRLICVQHAWWASGGRHWFPALLLAVLALGPHVAVAYVGGGTRAALLDVFETSASGGPQASGPISGTPEATTSTTTTTPTRSTTLAPTTTLGRITTTTTTPTTTTTMPATTTTTIPALLPERQNVLLLGGDAGPGRGGIRTDTMIVVSVEPDTGRAAMFGLPRNYGGFMFSDGTRFEGTILNSVYGWGLRHPEAFGGDHPGAAAVTDVIEHITGLEIDYFMLVDLTGFADVVDVFGGVTLDVPRAIYGPLYDTETGGYDMTVIAPGTQTLSGAEALAYSRARYGSSDYDRMGRQRCLLTSMVAQAHPLELMVRFSSLVETLQTHVTTDLPVDVLAELIRLLPAVQSGDIHLLGFDRSWTTGETRHGYPIPDIGRIRAAVARTIEDPAAAAELGALVSGEACG